MTTALLPRFKKPPQRAGVGLVGAELNRINPGGAKQFQELGLRLGLSLGEGDSLALETLFFADDIRARSEIDVAVAEIEVKKPELDLARQVIASLVGAYEPEEFENSYRQELRAMQGA